MSCDFLRSGRKSVSLVILGGSGGGSSASKPPPARSCCAKQDHVSHPAISCPTAPGCNRLLFAEGHDPSDSKLQGSRVGNVRCKTPLTEMEEVIQSKKHESGSTREAGLQTALLGRSTCQSK